MPSPDHLAKLPPTSRRRAHLAERSARRAEQNASFEKAASLLHTDTPGLLQPESALEHTYHVRQAHLAPHLDLATHSKSAFKLDLSSSNLSPYTHACYSRSGRNLLVASRRGHVAVSNWRRATASAELHLNETLRDATFLHDDAFFATAQRTYAHIYDAASGAQVHELRNHAQPGRLISLPHHLLLASVSAPVAPAPRLVYTDTSTGTVAASHDLSRLGGASSANTKVSALGSVADAALDAATGVVHLAHASGVVSLWAPTSPRPLARVFAHEGGVRYVGVMHAARQVVTVGADAFVRLTDLRNYQTSTLCRLPAPATALALSQRLMVAVAFGATVQVWTTGGAAASAVLRVGSGGGGGGRGDGCGAPYMSETFSGRRVTGLDFCPFEDVLAVCHADGMFSMLVPGAGEPTFDTSAPNPYETKRQRRENTVRALLDKLPVSTIALDTSFVGDVDDDPEERARKLQELRDEANIARLNRRAKFAKKKAKGRSKISKQLRNKERNLTEARTLERKGQREGERATKELAKHIKDKDVAAAAAGTAPGGLEHNSDMPSALRRFVKSCDK